MSCGPGTSADGGECLPNPEDGGPDAGSVDGGEISCGPGTHLAGEVCLPDAMGSVRYEVRVAVAQLGADGFSQIPVFVIGTNADGTPATDTVVLTTSVPGEGTIAPQTFAVSAVGTTAYFTPCSSAADPACLGTFTINLALASAPSTVIAHSIPITLIAPSGVGSTAPCLIGGNVVFFDGDNGDYIHPGAATITQGMWSITSNMMPPSDITVHVRPTQSTQGLWWDLEFGSAQLNQPLAAQVYENAERAAFASPGHPGIDIGGDGRGCNMISGKFQIETLTATGATVSSFTATFEQRREGGSAALRGCVHFGG
jgi:hypothetical protein